MTLSSKTRATLDELNRAAWVSAVGEPVSGAFVVLRSWAEAAASCGSPEWQELLLEASNRYCESVAARSRKRWDEWNRIVGEVKPFAEELVERKVCSTVEANGLAKVFPDTVRWDILHACMEAEYADVFPPGFFASQAYWYVQGHFPCGWVGSFPEGRLVLY
jgi:hypothetical protein